MWGRAKTAHEVATAKFIQMSNLLDIIKDLRAEIEALKVQVLGRHEARMEEALQAEVTKERLENERLRSILKQIEDLPPMRERDRRTLAREGLFPGQGEKDGKA